MAENTVHSGKGSSRGIILAVLGLALFVLGVEMLGNGSAPDEEGAPDPVPEVSE